MSIPISRYHEQQIVNSFNLFIDTEQPTSGNTGDDVNLHLEGHSVEARDGEVIRLSLSSFTMANNLYQIDDTNNRIRVRTTGTNPNPSVGTSASTSSDAILRLNIGNYGVLYSIVKNFAEQLQVILIAQAAASGATVTFTHTVKPSSADTLSEGNRLMKMVFTASTNHNLNSLVLQCEKSSESYQILGGKRIDTTSATAQSFNVTKTGGTTFTVEGYFPMQRMTDPYVYVRTDAGSNNLESVILSGNSNSSDVVNSNIVAKVFRDVEFISYNASIENEYFVNLQQRRLSSLRLFLTDSKGRRLGRLSGATGTAAGRQTTPGTFDSTEQSTLGNLFFTAVLKIDVVKVRDANYLQTTPPTPMLPARIAQSPYTWQDYGLPKH